MAVNTTTPLLILLIDRSALAKINNSTNIANPPLILKSVTVIINEKDK